MSWLIARGCMQWQLGCWAVLMSLPRRCAAAAAAAAAQVCCEANPRLTIRRARFSGGCCFWVAPRAPWHALHFCKHAQQTPHTRVNPLRPPPPPLPTHAAAAALIFADVSRAVHNLQMPNAHEAEAVDARQEIDLRIGASFTRLQTLLLQNKFDWGEYATGENGRVMLRCVGVGKGVRVGVKRCTGALWGRVTAHSLNSPLSHSFPIATCRSYGPCQFPTLGLIVQRAWEIQAHIPEQFWYIQVGAACQPASRMSFCSAALEQCALSLPAYLPTAFLLP